MTALKQHTKLAQFTQMVDTTLWLDMLLTLMFYF